MLEDGISTDQQVPLDPLLLESVGQLSYFAFAGILALSMLTKL